MAYNVVILRSVAADNVDSMNRSVVHTEDVQNGGIFELAEYSDKVDEKMVWKVKKPTAESKKVWMAYSPEVVLVKDAMGNEYAGLTKDPRAFINSANKVFDAFMLHEGDIIEMTAEGIATANSNKYLIPSTTTMLTSAGTAGSAKVYLEKVGTSHLNIGDGRQIAKKAVPTYIYEVKFA